LDRKTIDIGWRLITLCGFTAWSTTSIRVPMKRLTVTSSGVDTATVRHGGALCKLILAGAPVVKVDQL
jgi:hypothetical protein